MVPETLKTKQDIAISPGCLPELSDLIDEDTS